tara:strand:+ start:714 stop:983 length:270 start_codon:yes stop_codon:yes gene_type:complete
MKISKKRLMQIIREELNEAEMRFAILERLATLNGILKENLDIPSGKGNTGDVDNIVRNLKADAEDMKPSELELMLRKLDMLIKDLKAAK